MLNTLTGYEPLTGRLDRVLDELFRPTLWQAPASELAPMRVDVKETAEAYTVSAELPGLKKDEIQVEIEGNEVTISAETRREEKKEGEKYLRLERSFGKTARRFALPQDLDETKAVAKFTDGVLELTLPKKAAQAVKRIEVR